MSIKTSLPYVGREIGIDTRKKRLNEKQGLKRAHWRTWVQFLAKQPVRSSVLRQVTSFLCIKSTPIKEEKTYISLQNHFEI